MGDRKVTIKKWKIVEETRTSGEIVFALHLDGTEISKYTTLNDAKKELAFQKMVTAVKSKVVYEENVECEHGDNK